MKKISLAIALATALLTLGTTAALAQMKYNEAPQLKALVAAGELPPVEERLPPEPMVIQPAEEIGEYGGTWRRGWLGVSDRWGTGKILFERLLEFNWNGTEVLPNVATGWEASADGKVFTVHLRPGIKWSDGDPFDTEDIRFAYEDVMLNEDLTPNFPGWLIAGGERAVIEIVDDYSFRIRFAKPYGLFDINLVIRGGPHIPGALYAPSHYLKQFHPTYTEQDELDKMAKDANFEFWHQLFNHKADWVQNPDRPTISAWMMTVGPPAVQMVHERNPYYWKVDPAGNQLPYLDRKVTTLLENSEVLNLKLAAGELDFHFRHVRLTNATLFLEGRDRGDYRVLRWASADGASPLIMPNVSNKDPVLREIISDRRFRYALSLAIDRDEMNELVHSGLGKPRQASLIPGVPYYSEEWEKAFADYDPERAEAYLDEMGLTERDRDGFRLRPDGKTLALTIYLSGWGPGVDAMELIKEYWEDIGVKIALNNAERSLFVTATRANEHDIGIWGMDRHAPVIADMYWLVPRAPGYGIWANEYAKWYGSGGTSGEEPTGDLRRLYDLWDTVKVTVDADERDRLMNEIIALHAKNIWLIGTVGENPSLVIVKNNFRNVPERLVSDNGLMTPGNAEPEQFFIRQ